MVKELRPPIILLIALTPITSLLYPVAIAGGAQVLFPYQANGSLIIKDGNVIGSELMGQLFADAKYFHWRPSATTNPDPNDSSKAVDAPYNAANSAGANLRSHKQGPNRARQSRYGEVEGGKSHG